MSTRKKLAFALTTVTGLLLTLEMVLRACGVPSASQRRDPFAGFTPQVPHFQVGTDDGGNEAVTVAPNRRETMNAQHFPRHKAPGTYRIVCLGGSAIYGRPFFDHTSLAGWLRVLLPRADPSRKWEVINAGAISYASYRIKGLMAELSQYEPDLFIVYTGENEFLERRTYAGVFQTPGLIRTAAGLASDFRITTVMKYGLELVGLTRESPITSASGIRDEVVRIPVGTVGPDAYTRDEAFRRQVLMHFEHSLNAMVDLAQAVHARLMLVTPLSNLRDFAPFRSAHIVGLSDTQQQEWQGAYEHGRSFLRAGRVDEAVQWFTRARAIDGRHADLLYRTGQALLAAGDIAAARECLVRAREEDICPLRATSDTLRIIRRVASRRGVPLLDFEQQAGLRARHRIPGDELLCDHVHLQLAATKLLALDVLAGLVEERIATPAVLWGPAAVEQASREIEAGIDGPRYARELYQLSRLLDALGQPEQALKRVEEGLHLSKGDADGFCLAGRYTRKLGNHDASANFYAKALAIQPGAAPALEGLASLFLDEGKPAAAIGLLSEAVRSAPDTPSLLNLLGVAHARVGHHEQAVALLSRASLLLPREPAIHRNLALAQEHQGRYSDAALHYREALRLQPSDQQASKALDRIAATTASRKAGR